MGGVLGGQVRRWPLGSAGGAARCSCVTSSTLNSCSSTCPPLPTLPPNHSPTHPPHPSSPFARGKTNFFERRVGEYQRAGVMQSVLGQRKADYVFTTEEDF